MTWLSNFIKESNRIEGIFEITSKQVQAHEKFLDLSSLNVENVVTLVTALQPDAVLRDRFGLDVRVGNHMPPRGHEKMSEWLENTLTEANNNMDPYKVHLKYEDLHPFTDGNGRSGRAIWLWMMCNKSRGDSRQARQLGFLHSFYYQSLAASR